MPSRNTGKRGSKKKRPYRRPSLNSQPIYERYGLACGKEAGNPICGKKGAFKS